MTPHIHLNGSISKIYNLTEEDIIKLEELLEVYIDSTKYEQLKNKTNLPITQLKGNYSLLKQEGNSIFIATGLLIKLLKVLNPVKPTISKKILKAEVEKKPYRSLREEQILAVDKFLVNKRGIIKAPTSWGKTRLVAEFCRQFSADTKILILVPTVLLLYQMRQDIADYWKVNESEIGVIGDGNYNIRNITVGIPDTFYNQLNNGNQLTIDYLSSINVLVIDECISGDSLVLTDKGLIKIRDQKILNYKVLSFNENTKEFEFKKIIKHIPKGKKKTILLKTSVGELRCTKDHLVLTDAGWKQAQDLKPKDKIISI